MTCKSGIETGSTVKEAQRQFPLDAREMPLGLTFNVGECIPILPSSAPAGDADLSREFGLVGGRLGL